MYSFLLLTFSCDNKEGCELCTKLRLLVPEAMVIGVLGHESDDN